MKYYTNKCITMEKNNDKYFMIQTKGLGQEVWIEHNDEELGYHTVEQANNLFLNLKKQGYKVTYVDCERY